MATSVSFNERHPRVTALGPALGALLAVLLLIAVFWLFRGLLQASIDDVEVPQPPVLSMVPTPPPP